MSTTPVAISQAAAGSAPTIPGPAPPGAIAPYEKKIEKVASVRPNDATYPSVASHCGAES